MSSCASNLVIKQGKTFTRLLRWEAAPIIYKAITAIEQVAPVRLTVAGHGIPDGWRAAVTAVKGMTELNASIPPELDEYRKVTVVDTDTIEFNDVNAATYKAYASGGYVQYNTPVNMAGFTARMTIKDRVGGTTLETLTTENSAITIDNTVKTITLLLSATATAAYTWVKGVYDLEMVSASGVVTLLLSGDITVEKEVTT